MADAPTKRTPLWAIFGWGVLAMSVVQVVNYQSALPWLAAFPSGESIAYFAGAVLALPAIVTAAIAIYRAIRKPRTK